MYENFSVSQPIVIKLVVDNIDDFLTVSDFSVTCYVIIN